MTDDALTPLPVTPLRELYRALGHLKEQEQTAIAEAHAENPELLPHRLEQSVEQVAAYPRIDQPFYETREPLNPPLPPGSGRFDTTAFARHVADGKVREVEGCEALNFRYVDRELVPLRTKPGRGFSDGADWHKIRRLDLLLANAHDRTPIVAEVKIATDKLTHFAFIQALMATAELLPEHQRQRFSYLERAEHISDTSEVFDLYVIAFNPPSTGKYRERSYKATEEICQKLCQREDFSRHIRRTACIEAVEHDGGLRFHKRFAFEAQTGPL